MYSAIVLYGLFLLLGNVTHTSIPVVLKVKECKELKILYSN